MQSLLRVSPAENEQTTTMLATTRLTNITIKTKQRREMWSNYQAALPVR